MVPAEYFLDDIYIQADNPMVTGSIGQEILLKPLSKSVVRASKSAGENFDYELARHRKSLRRWG